MTKKTKYILAGLSIVIVGVYVFAPNPFDLSGDTRSKFTKWTSPTAAPKLGQVAVPVVRRQVMVMK